MAQPLAPSSAGPEALSVHPVADLFPQLSGEEYERFKADIAAHGLLEPIWVCDGQILDGRNRYRACLDLGVEIRTREYRGNSPSAFAWSLNGARRHLEKEELAAIKGQLAAIAVEMLPALKEEAKKRQATSTGGARPQLTAGPQEAGDGFSGEAAAQAAKIVGVGVRAVYDAKAIKALDPETFEQLKIGTVKNVEKTRKQLERKKAEAQKPARADGKKSREERSAEIRRLANEGHRASQIAEAIGVGEEHVREIARAERIALPDAAIGRTRKISIHRVIEQTVTTVEGCALGLRTAGLDDFSSLSATEAHEWADALAEPLRVLARLRKQLLEIAR